MRVALALAAMVFFVASGFSQTGTITTYAGRHAPPDGTPARTISFQPAGVVPDGSGRVYFTSDSGIFEVGTDGRTRLIATASSGMIPGLSFTQPFDVIRDASGNLLVTSSSRIWRITTGGISVIAGTGAQGFRGDGGPAVLAQFRSIASVAFDGSGNLYVSDVGNNLVRRIDTAGIITSIAGTGTAGFSGDNGPAIAAQLNRPSGIVVDPGGNLYVSDSSNNRVRKISPGGVITTVAGSGASTYNGDNIPATSASIGPEGLAFDRDGNLYIADRFHNRIRKVTPDGTISTIAGSGASGSDPTDGAPATAVGVNLPLDVAVDDSGNLYIAESTLVRKVTPDGIAHNLAGNAREQFSGDGGPAAAAQLYLPVSLTTDISGNLYIGDWANFRLRKVNPAGTISTLVLNSVQANGLAVDTEGNVYYTRSGQNFVSKVTPAGVVTIVAGSSSEGFSGDGGPATLAKLTRPFGLAMDLAGNLYIGDPVNRRIRKVFAGIITTVVSDTDSEGLATDREGNLYFANGETSSVYKVTPEGSLFRVAGNLAKGFSGDGGPAIQAQLDFPRAVVVDSAGALYIADGANQRVRKVDKTGIISTIAGTSIAGYSGDGGPAISARMVVPMALALDTDGNLYIADSFAAVVRKIEHVSPGGVPFLVSKGGTRSFRTEGSSGAMVSGFARIQSDVESGAPSSLEILSLRQNGVLISESTVPAVQPFRSGRFYAEIDGAVNTGVAIANPDVVPAVVQFLMTGAVGEVHSGVVFVPAGGLVAACLNQPLFGGPPSFRGTFSFSSNVPVGVVALRGLSNERGEFLMTTLPVMDLDSPMNASSFTFPHFVNGDGWTSQIVLTNPGDSQLTGTLSFFGPSGAPLFVTIEGQNRSSHTYSLPNAGHQRFVISGVSSSVQIGSVVVTPESGFAPSGLLILSFRKGGIAVTETGVPAIAEGAAFRIHIEAENSLQPGLAVANPSNGSLVLTLGLFRLDGSSTGATGLLTVPPQGQVSTFLREIPGFSSLLASFEGILRISSDAPFAVMGLRTRYNERGDFLITTSPTVDESASAATGAILPHFVDGGGYTTKFVLYSGTPEQEGTGVLLTSSPSGHSFHLIVR